MAKLFRVVKAGPGHKVGTLVMRVPAVMEGNKNYKYLGVWYNHVLYLWSNGANLARVKCTKTNLREFNKTISRVRADSKRLTLLGV